MHRSYLCHNLVIVFPLFALWENVVCLPGHLVQKYIQSRYEVRDDTTELTYSDMPIVGQLYAVADLVQRIKLSLTMLPYFCRAFMIPAGYGSEQKHLD